MTDYSNLALSSWRQLLAMWAPRISVEFSAVK